MFDERKTVYFQLPLRKTNERKIKSIVTKLEEFTHKKIKFIYHSKTKKVKSLFPIKDRIKHKANIVYKGSCSCNESCIAKRYAEIRWKEHFLIMTRKVKVLSIC